MQIIPAERLAKLASGVWERTKRRMEAVQRYIEGDDDTTAAIARRAVELGISKPMFYNLLVKRREWDAAMLLPAVRPPMPRRRVPFLTCSCESP